jgi:CRISPR-associated protein Cas2
MYVIITYDVAVERIDRVRAMLRQYLNWVQNSVFEGELTVGVLEEVSLKLRDVIDEQRDSVIVYTISNANWLEKKVVGVEKAEVSTVL